AQDAQRRLDEDRIDIVMVDIDLAVPNLVQPCATPDCLQMIRDIRANPRLRHMPVIAVTRHDDIVSIDGAYEAGATSFATKPVDWRVLQTQLRYVLRAQGLIAA
ncbi:MAG: response regulator, partial [Hyphomicrobiales bacterium]|nr:response regulator [Hyphomicrobiales bacterium]